MGSLKPSKAPVISISHGAGPLPLLDDPSQSALTHSLRTLVPSILHLNTPTQPSAILLITAHWNGDSEIRISSAKNPDLYFDYYGFPPHAYSFTHPANGDPNIAGKVLDALLSAHVKASLDDTRGWDHGVFVPMKLVDPTGQLNIVQMSILATADPLTYFKIGLALAPLREQGIAIVGSGLPSFHNLAKWFDDADRGSVSAKQKVWSQELKRAVCESRLKTRLEKLARWRDFEGSYEVHPKGHEEHFMPLLVCAAAMGEGEVKAWKDEMDWVDVESFYAE